MELITDIKSFIIQAPVGGIIGNDNLYRNELVNLIRLS